MRLQAIGYTLLAIGLLAGCAGTPAAGGTGGIGRLPNERVDDTAPAAHLAVSVREAAPAAFRTLYTRVPDWDQAVITLSNSSGTPATSNQTIPAVVDPATLVRSADATFTGLPPKGGYTIGLSLQKRNASGTGFTTIASGSQANFPVYLGANTIAVKLSLASGGGQVSVTVPKPVFP